MLEAKRDQTANDLSKPKTEVPETKPRRLLGLCVVLATNNHQRRTDSGFEYPEEDSRDNKRSVVFDTSRACNNDTPDDNIETQPFSSGQLL